MLDTPKYGWSHVSIGSWSDRCSYLDDVPMELLKAMKQFRTTHLPTPVKFDAEGYEYIILFDVGVVHVITESEADDGYTLTSLEVDYEALANELARDVRRDIGAWTRWLDYEHLSEEELAQRKVQLLTLCDEILAF